MQRYHESAVGLLLGLLLLPFGLPPSSCPAESAKDEPGGYSATEAARRMVLPEGFHSEIVASEPMIRQPVAAHFDERGRLWVVEYLQYPHPNGLTPVSVDVYLRTEYDRIPEPPPGGPRGLDRITILEDTDGDGKMDHSKLFVDGLNLASGVAVGHGGVYVAQAPYLLFYPDADRDDVPDGDPEVLLSGFGLQDAHAVLNSLTWGPDGWLYGAQGSTVTARIRGIEFQQGIWRYHPRTREFELFAEGGGNTWGLDFDDRGRILGSSNSHFVAFDMVQGGNYWKGFAKHGPLHNPRSFGYLKEVSYNGNKPGGHVTPGGIVYQADAYPERFRGAFIGGNLLSNTVYWHTLKPRGSTLEASFGGTLIDAKDTWFRPVDLLTGPDGCVLVVDWYDRRASHLDPRDNWDKSNGRIYRIVHGARPAVEPFDLATWSTDALIGLRTHPNSWWSAMARRVLSERRDPEAIPKLRALLESDREEPLALRDLWALDLCGGVDQEEACRLLSHPVAGVRRWAIRLLGDRHQMSPEIRTRLVELAATEPDPLLRSQLASSCQRWDAGEALPLIAALTSHDEDLSDEHIPLQIWWATERHLRTDPELVVESLGSASMQSRPLVSEVLLSRMAQAAILDGRFDLCTALLNDAPSASEKERVLQGMQEALVGRSIAEVPAPLVPTLDRLWNQSAHSENLVQIAVRMGHGEGYREATERALDRSVSTGERVRMIKLIGEVPRPTGRSTLLEILQSAPSSEVLEASLNAVGSYPDAEVAKGLLRRIGSLSPSLRSLAVDRLVARREWAMLLLDAIGSGDLDAKLLTTAQAESIARHGDEALAKQLETVWGKLPTSQDAIRRERIAELRGILPEGDKGKAERGSLVFEQKCSGCHRLFGRGETIGPELTGAERGNLEFLLESIATPSAIIRKEYQPVTLATKDGRVLNGLLVGESESAVTLFDSAQQRTTVARSQIEALKTSDVSLMPENVLDGLTDEQIRDLFRYLQSGGPDSAN